MIQNGAKLSEIIFRSKVERSCLCLFKESPIKASYIWIEKEKLASTLKNIGFDPILKRVGLVACRLHYNILMLNRLFYDPSHVIDTQNKSI